MGVSDARTLVLGGGFGGIAVATGLRDELGGAHEVLVVDRAPRFAMGLRKLWELVGHGTIQEGSRAREALRGGGVDFVQAEIRAIDPARRAVATDRGEMSGDNLVVALGAVPRPDLVAGLSEHGHDIWDPGGIAAAASALEGLRAGRVVMLIAGAPYPCPPAPYECAFLVDEHLAERGLRAGVEILVVTIQPMLMPNAGREGSDWMAERLGERGIEYRTGVDVREVRPGRIVLDGGEIEFDLLLAVPPHRAPGVVADSGLLGPSGWIEVDPATFETAHPGVYAVGDVTLVRLANGLPLPKAGAMAELEGARVARAIAAGDDAVPGFDGRGECFIEMGVDLAARFEGEFYAEPAPRIAMGQASEAYAQQKREFERARLAAWFGS